MSNSKSKALHTFPARIEEYFPETQTATVNICAEDVYNDIEGLDQISDWVLIPDVPVLTMSGGDFALTFPIVKGESCMITFSQIGYDHWFVEDRDTGGLLFGIPQPHLSRSFCLEDGFCFVGFNTLPRTFKQVSTTDVVLRNRPLTSTISIKPDGTIELKTISKVDVIAPNVNVQAAVVDVQATTSTTVTTPVAAVNATQTATVTAPNVAVNGTTAVALTAPQVQVNGYLKVTGAITASGSITEFV